MGKQQFWLLAAVFLSVWVFLDYLKSHGTLALIFGWCGIAAILLYYEGKG